MFNIKIQIITFPYENIQFLIIKWNLTQIKYEIGRGSIFMLSFSVMESVPISLLHFFKLLEKLDLVKTSKMRSDRLSDCSDFRWQGGLVSVVGNGIFVVQLSPLLLTTSIDFRTQSFKYQYNSNSYIKRCGWNHDVVNPKVVLMTQISSNH